MNFDKIRSDLYTNADHRRDLALAKAKAAYEAVQKTHEAYLDGVDAAIDTIERLSKEAPADRPVRNITPADVPKGGLPEASCKIRRTVGFYMDTATLKEAIEQNQLDKFISPFDEIDIPLDNGETVTVVCGYSDSKMARFVFKDCWDEHVMNEKNTNETGYYGSDARKHVLEDIYPHLPQRWRDIIKPRQIVEVVDGEEVRYEDPLWLPSATDVFGPPENEWRPVESDSFQLPIFQRARDRVKECGDKETVRWGLRSVRSTNDTDFFCADESGIIGNYDAFVSFGFAPGFDI